MGSIVSICSKDPLDCLIDDMVKYCRKMEYAYPSVKLVRKYIKKEGNMRIGSILKDYHLNPGEIHYTFFTYHDWNTYCQINIYCARVYKEYVIEIRPYTDGISVSSYQTNPHHFQCD